MKQRNETKSCFQSIQFTPQNNCGEAATHCRFYQLATEIFRTSWIATIETQASLTLRNLLGWERILRYKLPGTGLSWWPQYLIQSPQWPIRALTEKIRGQGKTTWPGWFHHQSLPEVKPCLREGGQSLQKKVLPGTTAMSTVGEVTQLSRQRG